MKSKTIAWSFLDTLSVDEFKETLPPWTTIARIGFWFKMVADDSFEDKDLLLVKALGTNPSVVWFSIRFF